MQVRTALRRVISGFRRDVDEICALLRCYAALNGNSIQTFRENLSVIIFKGQEIMTLEDGTDTLSRNVGAELPLDAE
jgi:hypothetical protein